MRRTRKYDVSGFSEAQFEPGSRGRVLKNLCGIVHKRDMDREEAAAYLRATNLSVGQFGETHRFTEKDLQWMHVTWLGRLYDWAGQYRRVNLSKGDLPFAAARLIPRLMKEFEKKILARYTPCLGLPESSLLEALAVVHVELILIHPFREGNGRVARLLAILMGLQAGLPPLDFGGMPRKRKAYFGAVTSGLDRNYEPMKAIFSSVVRRTRRLAGDQGNSYGIGRSVATRSVSGGRPRSPSKRRPK